MDQQLSSFVSDPELECVVVYAAKTNDKGSPTLEVVGQHPKEILKNLGSIEDDPDLRAPSLNRRWYPLQEDTVLLGVLRAERRHSEEQWSDALDKRLQISATSLAHCLSLELDRQKLLEELTQHKDQIGILIHQLRNPLTALRTYAQLLLRKLDPESSQRNLVEALLTEQKQVDKYLLALDQIAHPKLKSSSLVAARLLLPPLITAKENLNLMELLNPLIDRASATAKLQGYSWYGPCDIDIPIWLQEPRPVKEGVIAEIVANLLENAFRYSPPNASIGISFNNSGICVWDNGPMIEESERTKIFMKGYRNPKSELFKGSGIGLSLGKDLAREFGGELILSVNPSCFNKKLPKEGNAFIIKMPEK